MAHFEELAEALKTLENGPFHQLSQPPNSRRDDPDLFMAHLDFRPDNGKSRQIIHDQD